MQSHSKNFKRTTLIVSKCVFVFPFFYGDGKELRKKKKIWKKGPSSCWQLLATVIDAGLCVCSPNPILVDEPYEETEREKWDRLARDLTRKTLYSIGFDDLFLPLKMMMMMITFTSRPGKPSHTHRWPILYTLFFLFFCLISQSTANLFTSDHFPPFFSSSFYSQNKIENKSHPLISK